MHIQITDSIHKNDWLIVSFFILLTVILLFLSASKILFYLFPLLCIVIGFYFYAKSPNFYIGFTLCLWFFVPFVRRIIDFQSGDLTPGNSLLIPGMVTIISSLTFFKDLPKENKNKFIPFLLCLLGLFYGFLNGHIQNNILLSTYSALILMSSPIFFSYHLYSNWNNYFSYKATLINVFKYGLLIMAIYGIYQKINFPDWDSFNLIGLGRYNDMSSDIDQSLVTGIFSTTSGRQQFACFIVACLLLSISSKINLISLFGYSLGSFTILLSQARAGWLSLIVSISVYMISAKYDYKNIFFFVSLSLFCIAIGLSLDFSGDSINDRLNSLFYPDQDNSLNIRKGAYNELLAGAIVNIFGYGLGFDLRSFDAGIGSFDGSILPMLFSLGWFGVVLYLIGIFMAFVKMLTAKVYVYDSFLFASKSIAIGIFFQIGFNFIFIESPAIVMWTFCGMSLAGTEYYFSIKSKSIDRESIIDYHKKCNL